MHEFLTQSTDEMHSACHVPLNLSYFTEKVGSGRKM
jgi:hypothetical protein